MSDFRNPNSAWPGVASCVSVIISIFILPYVIMLAIDCNWKKLFIWTFVEIGMIFNTCIHNWSACEIEEHVPFRK